MSLKRKFFKKKKFETMMELFLPWLRLLKHTFLPMRAQYAARYVKRYDACDFPSLAFIVGCGRSGTSILGKVLSLHPQICYLFEPLYLWTAVNPTCDVTNFYRTCAASLIMDESQWSRHAQLRFKRLLHYECGNGVDLVVEKTPHNAMRIGFIERLAPNSKFIHIVRNGVDTAASIAHLASTNDYWVAFKRNHNQWWGRENCKWKNLKRDGSRAGYFGDEVNMLQNDFQRGAYEWLVSLAEVDRWRSRLKNRLFELTYDNFLNNTEGSLRTVCVFLSITCPGDWLSLCHNLIKASSRKQPQLTLPSGMCKAFNEYQKRYGFSKSAFPTTGEPYSVH